MSLLVSIVVAGTISFFDDDERYDGNGAQLSTRLYLAFSVGSVLSRPTAVVVRGLAPRPPSPLAIEALSTARVAATALVFLVAFDARAAPALASEGFLLALFFALSLSGGVIQTWAFQIACEACADADAAVEAARTCNLASNAGLTIGGVVNCVLALTLPG